MNEKKPMLIVGLGNPGARYARTRHNVGFMAVDELSRRSGGEGGWKSEHKSLVAKIPGVIFAKPQNFMNLSGAAVQSLMAFYKIPIENLVVIHDDVDLKTGEVREKTGGGSAGHNGIRSIDGLVGNNYRRIRIGVGRPESREPRGGLVGFLLGASRTAPTTADWVLGKFTDDELKIINSAIENINI